MGDAEVAMMYRRNLARALVWLTLHPVDRARTIDAEHLAEQIGSSFDAVSDARVILRQNQQREVSDV
jgi:hypothetical protein